MALEVVRWFDRWLSVKILLIETILRIVVVFFVKAKNIVMRKKFWIFGIQWFVGLYLAILSVPSFGLTPMISGVIEEMDPSPCTPPAPNFRIGEEVTYKLYYHLAPLWLAAGEVTFRVEDAGDTYHLSAIGKTFPFYEWFFKVRDEYHSYVDKKTLLPTVSIRDIQEGGYSLYEKIVFDQDAGTAVSDRGKSKDNLKRTSYTPGNCMHDMLSVIYYMRTLDYDNLKQGQLIPVEIFMDKEVWPLDVEYLGKEAETRVKGQGDFRTIRFSPEVIEGYIFKKDTRMNVWVSDDGDRIPLLIESPVSVGKIKAVLNSPFSQVVQGGIRVPGLFVIFIFLSFIAFGKHYIKRFFGLRN